ncbi:hypothetical protein [Thiobacillus denitrificans]|uniref:hypothetical protein n=1 Tax=Thiobacillus denitrificans TaxID=36861 RepID=UPI0004779C3A|nr:hypothetical protein [Thiobacillus denitrificans]
MDTIKKLLIKLAIINMVIFGTSSALAESGEIFLNCTNVSLEKHDGKLVNRVKVADFGYTISADRTKIKEWGDSSWRPLQVTEDKYIFGNETYISRTTGRYFSIDKRETYFYVVEAACSRAKKEPFKF